jgi:transposase
MNFNRTNTTNQRIERITMQTAVVGIDIAKDVHAAQVTDFRGRSLTSRHLSFINNIRGFEKLLDWIQGVQSKHRMTSVIIGLEPTGHYWFNLTQWLLEHEIPVVLVNPVTTHRNKENRDNSPSKSDPKDALVIADLVSRGYYTDYLPQEEEFERIKTLMSDREYWVKMSVSLGNRIVRWIDLYFPEFRQVFKDWTCLRSIASLKAFPLPNDLQGLTAEEVIQGWYEQGMRRAGGLTGRAKAEELHRAASSSIGYTRSLEEARRDIARLIEAYERIEEQLAEMQREVEALLEDIPMAHQLQSIKGFGTVPIAAVLACAGDLRLYAHGRQLLRRAGLNLAERTSGKYKGEIKLSKRGDSMLRKYLYWGVMSLVGQNLEFKSLHKRNQQKGMTKMASLFKCIGKLARVIIGMVQRGEVYRPDQLQMQAA